MKKYVEILKCRLLSIKSPIKLYLACIIGVGVGVFIDSDLRWPILLVISIAFSLNIVFMLLGIFVTILSPMIQLLISWLSHQINFNDLPDNIILQNTMKEEPISKFQLLGFIIIVMLISLLILQLFRFLYNEYVTKVKETTSVKKYIFIDSTGNRILFLKKIFFIFLPVIIIVVSTYLITLVSSPQLSALEFEQINGNANVRSVTENILNLTSLATNDDDLSYTPIYEIDETFSVDKTNVFAFYVPWDENSFVSLKQNYSNIDVVIPEWFHLEEDLNIASDRQVEVDELMNKNNVKVMPLIHNLINGKWDSEVVHKLISSPDNMNKFIQDILNILNTGEYYGINIDFENLDTKDKDAFTYFIKELSSKLHEEGYKVSLDLSVDADDMYDVKALVNYADYLIMMLYDEHYSTGISGPVASQEWFKQRVEEFSEIPKDKLIIALGNYGYDWDVSQNTPAVSLTFSNIVDIAREGDLKINWDVDKQNPYVMYEDGTNQHIIWFLDGATAYNELKYSVSEGVTNFALWVLGSEDPTIWEFLNKGSNADNYIEKLETQEVSPFVRYLGEGEIIRVTSTSSDGRRSIKVNNEDGFIVDESYSVYSEPFTVNKLGQSDQKKIVLTFDDGPDQEYTPQILDILAEYDVKGVFFVIGTNAFENTELLKRIYDEGHEIGNHTFFHPNIANISDIRLKQELNLNQRLIQDITGHSTVLFRMPSGLNLFSPFPDEYSVVKKVQDLGYTVVDQLVDTKDWQVDTAQDVYQNAMDRLLEGRIILLHDSGGDRSNTVEALPMIIETLKNEGYEFTSIADLMGKTSDEIMPPVPESDNIYTIYSMSVMELTVRLTTFVRILFFITTILGILRLVFLILYSFKHYKKSSKHQVDSTFKPLVSVIIAAYNEEKVICKTISSVLNNNYKNLEIIVVNDGSTDNTSEVVRNTFGTNERMTLLEKINGGKSSALNLGFKYADGEIVVAIDADTMISIDSISLMVSHFIDENVAAVSGNVKIGNVHNLLTKWQHIEYVTAFNLEKRALAEINSVSVVPGAIGAWRKDVVAEYGYYAEDTLAEDTDMTLELLRNGYKVKYEEKAFAYTEAPSDLSSFLNQRARWSYGILQCIWKRKDMLFNTRNKSLGFIVLPNYWLFQYGFVLLVPLVDILFIMGLFVGSNTVIIYYMLFMLTDYIAAMYAFSLENEKKGVLVWLFLQRIIYHMLICYIVIKSIISAIHGIKKGWNKLERTGDVFVHCNKL